MPNGRMEQAGIEAVIRNLGQFKAGAKEMDNAIKGIGTTADQTKAPVSRLQQSFADLEAKAAKAIIPLAAISAVLVATVGKMVMTAARTQELGVVVENMGRVAGYSEGELTKVEKEIKDLGITTQSARTIMTRFIGAELDLADASKVARAAQDLAVIGMQDSSTAAANLTYAIASMQPRILRQYGLFINLNKVYEETATTLGKTAETLTTAEKRQGFLNAVLKQASNYAGTYQAAMGTAGKQLRSFRRYTEEVSNELGQHFLPYLGEGVSLATDFAKAILALSDEQKEGVARVLMYATAISVMATAGASAVLVLGKLKAALLFLLSPYALVAAAIGFLVVRGIEWRMELQKQRAEIKETAKSAEEYAEQILELEGLTKEIVDHARPWREELRKTKEEERRAALIAEWHREKLTEQALEIKKLTAVTQERVRVVARQITEEEILAYTLEHVSDAVKGMAKSMYGNIVALQDNIAAYDELKNKVISVYADTSEATYRYQTATTRAAEDAALRREELLEKHAEKIAWVESGAHARSAKEHEEALAYWMAINAQELAEFDAGIALKEQRRTEDYNHQIATAQAAAAERTRIAEEQRQAELQAMREAQEERLTMLALEMIAAHETLTVMSPWGELEVSADEYYQAVKSGLVPVSDAMRENLGAAIQFIDDSMTTANENIGKGYGTLSDIIGDVVPDVMELGTETTEESEAMTEAMEQNLRPAIEGTAEDIFALRDKVGIWAEANSEATTQVGESWDALHKPLDDASAKVSETEQSYDESISAMQEATDKGFKAIDKTVKERMRAVKTTVKDKMGEIKEVLDSYEEKFRSSGRRMIQGLINGILDKQDEAEQAMARLVRAMIRAAEEAAGLGSPSRLFMGMGQDVMGGFIKGIESMRPALETQMEMTLAPVMQVAAPAATASPVLVQGGHTYNFNLSAQYAQTQSPASILDDLAAMQMLAQARG